MQAARHFVERAFEDAKDAWRQADYPLRGFNAWRHHMALVMVVPVHSCGDESEVPIALIRLARWLAG